MMTSMSNPSWNAQAQSPRSAGSMFLFSTIIACQVLVPLLAVGCADDEASLTKVDLQARIKEAFSPVGEWRITKMKVELAAYRNQTVGAASINMEIASHLGQFGEFVVAEDGSVTGSGEAPYRFNVDAGVGGVPVPGGTMDIEAAANLFPPFELPFKVKGKVDLEAKTMSLAAFEPEGNLKIMISGKTGPVTGAVPTDWPAWPPMV